MNRPVKVLHLIDSLDLGGAQTALIDWLQYGDRTRFNYSLAAIHGTCRSLFFSRAAALNVPLLCCSPRKWLPAYLFRLPVEMIRSRYDVVHCHLFASNWLGKPFARFFGVPVVVSHDHCNDRFRSESLLVTFLDRWANQYSDKVIVVSNSIRDFLIRSEQVNPARIEVMPPGIAERGSILRERSWGWRVGGAGRLVAQKNFERFLLIARELSRLDSRFTFHIAGSGPMEGALRARAQKLGVQVNWRGATSGLDQFLQEIDLFLLTSDFEGLPRVILESLQMGVPVASTSVDGIADHLSDVVLSYSGDDPLDAVARRIYEVLSDRARHESLIRIGQARVREHFSARAQMTRMEEIYLSTLQQKRAARSSA